MTIPSINMLQIKFVCDEYHTDGFDIPYIAIPSYLSGAYFTNRN